MHHCLPSRAAVLAAASTAAAAAAAAVATIVEAAAAVTDSVVAAGKQLMQLVESCVNRRFSVSYGRDIRNVIWLSLNHFLQSSYGSRVLQAVHCKPRPASHVMPVAFCKLRTERHVLYAKSCKPRPASSTPARHLLYYYYYYYYYYTNLYSASYTPTGRRRLTRNIQLKAK